MQVEVRTIRGVPTGWLQQGRGSKSDPILFFIHGFPDMPQTWEAQIKFFSSAYLTIAPYARGISPSEPENNSTRFGMDSIVLDHLAILRHVDPSGCRPVVVIGHDIGAVHAWHFARLLQHRLHALVVINGTSLDQMVGRIGYIKQMLKSWYIAFFQLPFLPEWVMSQWGDSIFSRIRKRQGAVSTTAPAEILIPMIEMYRQVLRQAFFYRTSSYPKISSPTLILWGNKDPFLEIPSAVELRRICKSHTMRVLNGGHWIHEEQSDHVNNLIQNFFEKNTMWRKTYAVRTHISA